MDFLTFDILFRYTNMTVVDIVKHCGVSHWTVRKYLQENYSVAFRNYRHQRVKSAGQRGIPRATVGVLNGNYKGGITTSYGYKMCKTPSWYTGKSINGYTMEHRVNYCEANGITEIPHGYIIHHKDGDKLNNNPKNLELLSRSEHAQLHANIRRDHNGFPNI